MDEKITNQQIVVLNAQKNFNQGQFNLQMMQIDGRISMLQTQLDKVKAGIPITPTPAIPA